MVELFYIGLALLVAVLGLMFMITVANWRPLTAHMRQHYWLCPQCKGGRVRVDGDCMCTCLDCGHEYPEPGSFDEGR